MTKRKIRIDEIRGITLISMILYHFMWDLKFIAGYNMEWYVGPWGNLWQKSICMTFIFISGFCFCFGRNHLRRGLITFFSGALVSAVTLIFFPENRVVFGVLTFIGSASLLMILIDMFHEKLEKKLDRTTISLTMLIGSIMFFIVFFYINRGELNLVFTRISVPRYMYSGYFMTYLGFVDPTFYSTDYFSILPWIFLYMTGYYLYRLLCCSRRNAVNSQNEALEEQIIGQKIFNHLEKGICKPLEYIGSHTLIIYLLHQPILYAITLLITLHK